MNNNDNTTNNEPHNGGNQNPNENYAKSSKKSKGAIFGVRYKTIGMVVLALIIIVGGYFGVKEYLYYHSHVTTNDAKTNGHINPVISRVSGFVDSVYVKNNEQVHKGEILVQIDTTDYALKVQMAKSALQNARASLGVAKANVQAAQVAFENAQTDYNRVKNLFKGGATTKSKFQHEQSKYKSAKAQLVKAKRSVKVSVNQIQSKKDQLENAKLHLSYTIIRAGSAGLISQKNIKTGQYITANQPMMSLTDIQNVWVTANFKETGLYDIHVGQKVNISIDAYPHKNFEGRVQSIAGATGSKFSLLPSSNAT